MDREWVTRCVAKPLELSRMKLANDLATRVPADLGLSDQRRLLVGTFLATGLAVAVVHAFLPGSGRLLGEVIVHALVLATTYTVCVLVVAACCFSSFKEPSSKWKRGIYGSCLFWPTISVTSLTSLLARTADLPCIPMRTPKAPWFHYARLVPIWIVITYLFIQNPHTSGA